MKEEQSAGGARERSPGRKPWVVGWRDRFSPVGATEEPRVAGHWNLSPLRGLTIKSRRVLGLAPWATCLRPSGTVKTRCQVMVVLIVVVIALAAIVPAQTATDSQHLGLVISAKPWEPPEPAEPPLVYAQFIDPVNGLTADELVRYALAHNGELAAARQTIAEARGRLRQAGLKPNPTIESSGTRAVTSPDNMAMIGAELPLELGGRRKARVEVAQRELEMREAEVADFERKLAAEVRTKYADAVAAARNLKFTEDLVTLPGASHRLR